MRPTWPNAGSIHGTIDGKPPQVHGTLRNPHPDDRSLLRPIRGYRDLLPDLDRRPRDARREGSSLAQESEWVFKRWIDRAR